MKDIQFPFFQTKIGEKEFFDLSDPQQSKVYFERKAGKEIEKLRNYLSQNTFIAYFLGKKNCGKGTYAKMLAEVVLPEKIDHFSIGDMVRKIDEEIRDEKKRKELFSFLEKNYRGWLSLEEIFLALEKRNTKTLLPNELILTLVKREIGLKEKKIIFIDGFPRDLDQINFSLFFRDLIGYRDDQDIFVLIDVPESVIEERMKWRRVCPVCQTSRNLKLLPTKRIGYDEETKEFYLICDNSQCSGQKMVKKEGDELGKEGIKERLEKDEKLIKQAFFLYGVPKVLLRNSLPIQLAKEFFDDYEITPEFSYQWDKNKKEVKIIKKPWQILDDEGIPSFSLLPQPVVVSFIKQLVKIFQL